MALAAAPIKAFGDTEFSLSGDYLLYCRDFAFLKGISTGELLQDTGIPLDVLLNPPDRIAHAYIHPLTENLISALPDPYQTAVEYGQFLQERKHGLLELAIQGANNLSEAGQLLVQYMVTRTSVQTVEVISDDEYYRLRFHDNPHYDFEAPEPVLVFFELATLVSLESILRRLLTGYELPGQTEMHFTVSKPDAIPVYLRKLNCQIVFHQAYAELCVPAAWAALPFKTVDRELRAAAEQLCATELRNLKPRDIVERLLEQIQQIEGEKPSLDEMAAEMFMSVSTLQRRLKEQGMTYQQLKSEARLRQARQLLIAGHLSMDDVASRLGFSDVSNFSKSFKSWVGMTPGGFRKKHLQKQDSL